MRIILITGMPGSRKPVALNVLEDAGYYCIDNLPAQFIPELARYLADQGYMHLGVVAGIRSRESPREVPETATVLREEHDVRILFLTASVATLVQRYPETRCQYPLSIRNGHPDTTANVQTAARDLGASLIEAIEMEHELFNSLADPAHRIDTNALHTNALHAYIRKLISDEPHDITLIFESFSLKHGVSTDADLVFDVRSLPNPYCDTQLRLLTGRDQPVTDFLQSQPMVLATAEGIRAYVEKRLPSFIADNRSYLTVAIGCTGGQHRSVYIAERLTTYFRTHGNVLVRHRGLAVDG